MPGSVRDLVDRGKRQARSAQRVLLRSRERRRWVQQRHTQSPPLRQALAADVAMTLHFRGEGRPDLSRTELALEAVRLSWSSDAFLAQVLYRARISALRRGVPGLPRVLHLGSMVLSQVCIGDPVIVKPGLYIPHGQIVVDGITEVGSDVILFPWSTVGLRGGNFQGPAIGDGVHVGTGAKVIGAVAVGRAARIGANAVVVSDVAAGATAVGVPARTSRVDARRG
ncbi:MAG: hypothetical protein U0R27_02425 [Candidatus Nanopelagicales bacterium]